MTDSAGANHRTPFYEGRKVPLGSLTDVEFEAFVFSSFLCISDVIGVEVTGNPSGTGDGGFDVQGVVVDSKRIACIQCKRQEAPLDTPQVATELAKVAATSKLEQSNVGEHRFICSGGVRTKLRKQLRQESRQDLIREAGERLATDATGELATLRSKLEAIGEDPRQVAEDYVHKLDRLIAWDAAEFDTALSSRWDKVLSVIERYFHVATVVREHPRALFDRAAYVAEHQRFRTLVEPRFNKASLPEGHALDPALRASSKPSAQARNVQSLEDLVELGEGDLLVLVGDGGIGKSTALELVRAEAIRDAPLSTLPVLISLKNYTPGSLDRLIHQELGVDHGSWRALPDRVLLLCDGLNECQSESVSVFLDELKPLLKRKQVACLLSTRGSAKHTRVLFPQMPVACVEVMPFTPIAVQRIAENHLPASSCTEFVRAYKSLAAKAGSSHLWTPFAVLTAVAIWQRTNALPATLSKMLDALLLSRCNRDSETGSGLTDPTTILELAGTLAFQCVVTDRRLACPAREAGKWIRSAKAHCSDALGIADMTESAIVDLLVRHEFLRRHSDGYLSFGHQLVAGALAAPILAQVWQQHTDSLDEAVVDDAWVFAAPLVPREQIASYLARVFDTSLILGARAALELSIEDQAIAERLLERAVASTSPETVRVKGMFALAKLATSRSISLLQKLVTDTNDETRSTARMALAAVGDPIYLRPLLFEVEKLKSGPFTVSGGEVAIWESAPLVVRLDLARQHLKESAPGSHVAESLWLIGYERDAGDLELVEKHLHAADDIKTWQFALSAINRISHVRAKELLDQTLSENSSCVLQAEYIRFAHFVGVEVNVRVAFDCILSAHNVADTDHHAQIELSQLVSDVISQSTLPPELVARIESELPCAEGMRRRLCWSIAKYCASSKLAEYATSRIKTLEGDYGLACNFFVEQPDLARTYGSELMGICEACLAEEKKWYSWDSSKLLALMHCVGFTPVAAGVLTSMIERLDRLRCAIQTESLESLSAGDAAVIESKEPQDALSHVERLAAQLMPGAACAHSSLSAKTKLVLLHVDSHTLGVVDHQSKLLSEVGDEEVDVALLSIDDASMRHSGLVLACSRGATDRRIQLLASEITHFYGSPSSMTRITKAVDACWCASVCRMVASTVAEIPSWSDFQSRFFWDFTEMVANHLVPTDQPSIEESLAVAKTVFASRILTMWRDAASGRRVGLAWLNY